MTNRVVARNKFYGANVVFITLIERCESKIKLILSACPQTLYTKSNWLLKPLILLWCGHFCSGQLPVAIFTHALWLLLTTSCMQRKIFYMYGFLGPRPLPLGSCSPPKLVICSIVEPLYLKDNGTSLVSPSYKILYLKKAAFQGTPVLIDIQTQEWIPTIQKLRGARFGWNQGNFMAFLSDSQRTESR